MADILEYLVRESGSLATGLGFVDGLRNKCSHLAALPGTLGRARPALRPDIRSFAHRGYVILRYQQDIFEVVNIIEGHRDLIAYFRDDVTE